MRHNSVVQLLLLLYCERGTMACNKAQALAPAHSPGTVTC